MCIIIMCNIELINKICLYYNVYLFQRNKTLSYNKQYDAPVVK